MVKVAKTLKQRLSEAMQLYQRMILAGFELEELKKFRAVMNGWAKTGKFFEGRIELEGYQRIMLIQLFNKVGQENIIVLRNKQ